MGIRIIETPRGREYVFNNKFSKNVVPLDDRRLTAFLHFKYKLINKMHLGKFFEKKGWYRMMDEYWAMPNQEELKSAEECAKQETILTKDDLELKELIIYDLLPKEYIEVFQEKYSGFKNIFAKNSGFNRQARELNRSFTIMKNSRVVGCWFNVDGFFIKNDTEFGKYFSLISIEAIGLTESFFILKYALEVTEYVNEELINILGNKIYKSPICLSNGNWWKRKSFAGCIPYDYFNDPKKCVLEDYILELKSIFWKQINKHLMSKSFNWEIIPPSIEVYSSNSLDKNSKEILSTLSSSGTHMVEQNDDKSVYIVFASNNTKQLGLHNSKIIANSKEFEGKKEGQLYSFMNIEEVVCQNLADYFILEALNQTISGNIYDAQLRINKVVGSKRKLRSFLKIKIKIDKKLYFYKRLCKELADQFKEKTENNKNLDKYKGLFNNKHCNEYPDSPFFYDFNSEYNLLYGILVENNKLLISVYEHFAEYANIVENTFNYKLVKWTFAIGVLSLIATILFANDSYILLEIFKFFCGKK